MMPPIDRSALRFGDELGNGNQGTVWSLRDDPAHVAKLFDVPVKESGLIALIEARDQLSAADRALLDACTAWPTRVIHDRGICCGFIMVRIPPQFFSTAFQPPLLIQLQHALHADRAAKANLHAFSDGDRVAIALMFVEILDLLHRMNVGLRDISQRNLLLAPGDPRPVFIIDIDSAICRGRAALQEVATPDWIDPEPTADSISSDRYKAALVVYRLLHQQARAKPAADDRTLTAPAPPYNRELADLSVQALHGSPSSRPRASAWIPPLAAALAQTCSPPVPPRPARKPPHQSPQRANRGPARVGSHHRAPSMSPNSSPTRKSAPVANRLRREWQRLGGLLPGAVLALVVVAVVLAVTR